MANTLKVRVVLEVEVDRDAIEESYGIENTAVAIREDVKYSALNSLNAAYGDDRVIVNARLANA